MERALDDGGSPKAEFKAFSTCERLKECDRQDQSLIVTFGAEAGTETAPPAEETTTTTGTTTTTASAEEGPMGSDGAEGGWMMLVADYIF